MKTGFLISLLSWLCIVFLSLVWNMQQSDKQYEQLALYSARSLFQQIVLTRQWSAEHGGLYVPITEKTQPNPYLDVKMRDLKINDDLQLTKLNPSYMTRQLSELAASSNGIHFHITSLNPIRPGNKATPWEKEALTLFHNGAKEKSQFIKNDDQYNFRYMAPLYAKKTCLGCHPDYSEGDIRGGISISMPIVEKNNKLPIYVGHLFFALVGLVGVIIFWLILSHAYRKIQYQSVIDPLTGIANRRDFSTRIVTEFNLAKRNRKPLSILMCDIDNFKEYNDIYGHTAGDTVLKQVAQTIKQSINRPSDFCARYGGEEFIVILPHTTETGAKKVSNNILQNIVNLNISHIKSPSNYLTVSIGAATNLKKSLLSYEDLIKRADQALYLAKKNGKNRVELFSENKDTLP